MSRSETIYRLGHWIASHKPGVLRLSWKDRELFLTLREGKIVSAVGPSPRRLARLLGPGIRVDEADLMIAARQAAEKNQLPIEESVGAVKVLIQEDLSQWLCDPNRELKLLDEQPELGPDPNISFQHALIELILTARDDIYSQHILPDRSKALRRHRNFSEQYGALRLSEEADLVVARIDGHRDIAEVLTRSSLPEAEIHRLLAALTSAGILEIVEPEKREEAPEPPEPPEPELIVSVMKEDEDETSNAHKKKLPPWIVLVAAASILLIIALSVFLYFGPFQSQEKTPVGEHWGVVVDLACEAGEYRRLMETANRRKDVLALPTDEDSSSPCWRLIWGDFPNRRDAEDAIRKIPKDLRHEGFKAHVLEYHPQPTPDKVD